MDTKRYLLCELGEKMILLGKQGESGALRIEFDCAPWLEEYPAATIKLFVFNKAHRQDDPILPVLGSEGALRVWIVGEDETAASGHGVIELVLQDADTGSTLKSATGYTTVVRSPSAGIEAREAQAGYVRYDLDQSEILTEEQKAIARKNIGAGTGSGTGGGIVVETDPTVPSWAKQATKPSYTAAEVGALPSTYVPPNQTAAQVGADPVGTAAQVIGAHDVDDEAHEDIRSLITGLTNRLNALANSDDTTLDQMAEIVAYIKNNKSLIDAVTTGKVSTSDIVNNLTTNVSTKVLSAAQGVALKALIDAIVIPTSLPNPQPIVINGESYDGSVKKEITIQPGSSTGGAAIDDTTPSTGTTYSSSKIDELLSEQKEAIDNKVGTDDLNTAVENALTEAKNSGDFKGDPGEPGDDYVLTDEDKEEIAGMVEGPSYTLPIANETTLGGVKPAVKTDEMTQEIGVDADGKLWGLPGGNAGASGDVIDVLMDVTLEEEVSYIILDLDEPREYKEFYVKAEFKPTSTNDGNKVVQFRVNSSGVWSGEELAAVWEAQRPTTTMWVNVIAVLTAKGCLTHFSTWNGQENGPSNQFANIFKRNGLKRGTVVENVSVNTGGYNGVLGVGSTIYIEGVRA